MKSLCVVVMLAVLAVCESCTTGGGSGVYAKHKDILHNYVASLLCNQAEWTGASHARAVPVEIACFVSEVTSGAVVVDGKQCKAVLFTLQRRKGRNADYLLYCDCNIKMPAVGWIHVLGADIDAIVKVDANWYHAAFSAD